MTSLSMQSNTPERIGHVTLTHPDRVVLRPPKTTKSDLAHYYEAIAPHMLEHLKGRRIAMLRCPDGADEDCFFQKHLTGDLPSGLTRDAGHLQIQSTEGLLALVQLGVIEFHTWGAHAPQHDNPDRVTIDLDPGPDISWRGLVEATQLAHGLMTEVGLAPFLKTTGGRGLHLVAPIRATRSWETVRILAHHLAQRLANAMPDRFTANMAKDQRHGRIFVDYLRNGNGATAICAYSVRARPEAPVSMPLPWAALDFHNDLRAAAFNVRNALDHVQTHEDPWHDYAARRTVLTQRMLDRLGL
ncbi:non-homologous end-joining DNA ligase [Bordetella muralis]|uniref:non-homologous end-joining DNA ligase n=1 Tax=Bordetella muralis TaxID=1649130 RepID=UPI0039F0A234